VGVGGSASQFGPSVQEKAFDEYHLYTLEHATTLLDRETKQVEMVRAAGIQSKAVYVYDGFKSTKTIRIGKWTTSASNFVHLAQHVTTAKGKNVPSVPLRRSGWCPG